MAGEEEERRRSSRSAPKTKTLQTISSPEIELPSNLKPKRMFVDTTPQGSVAVPAFSDPTGGRRKRGPKKTLLTPQGKHVLTSDARLHLERIKAKKRQEQGGRAYEVANLEDELQALDTKRRMLAAKVRQQREIARLEAEMGNAYQEYQTRDDEDVSWKPSANSEYPTRADSAGSYSSRHRKKRTSCDEEEEDETGSMSKSNLGLTKLRREVAQLRDQIKTGSGSLDAPSESPLSEEIENYRLDKHLKIPSIGQFDGSTAPSDFINQFDGI